MHKFIMILFIYVMKIQIFKPKSNGKLKTKTEKTVISHGIGTLTQPQMLFSSETEQIIFFVLC